MATQSLPELGSLEPNQHGYREFTLGKFTFNRDGYFAHIAWPKGTPHDPGRRVPARDAARRRVGILLRHRELRRGGGDGEPLRQRRSLRRPLQRSLPQVRPRLLRELPRRADLARLPGDPGGLDERRVRSLRRAAGDGLGLRAEERQQQGGDHPAPRDGQAHDRRAGRRADPQRRERLPDQSRHSPTCRRTRRRCWPSRASRARWWRSTSSPISRARTSRGIPRWCRCARPASTARPPRSTSCPSSTATTVSSGSCSSATRSSGRWRIATPARCARG